MAKISSQSGWTAVYEAMFVESADLQSFRGYRGGVLANDLAGRFYTDML